MPCLADVAPLTWTYHCQQLWQGPFGCRTQLHSLSLPPLACPSQVAMWEVNSHWQPSVVCSCCEDGGTITHAVWLSGQYAAPAACYAVSTPGSATVTLKCLNSSGAATVVQVGPCCDHMARMLWGWSSTAYSWQPEDQAWPGPCLF